jgi:hypothetical protein
VELRIRVEAYDEHDDVLDARRAALTSEQQAQHDHPADRISRVLATARQAASGKPVTDDQDPVLLDATALLEVPRNFPMIVCHSTPGFRTYQG